MKTRGAGRRANKDGSIYAVGDGWRYSLMVGLKPDGKPDRRGGRCATRGEASRKLGDLRETVRRGVNPAPAKMTVAGYAKTWLADVIAPRDKPNTFAYYDDNLRLHILPAIGSIKLNDLRPHHIRTMLNARRNTNTRRGKPYSRRSIEAMHKTIAAMLEQAVCDLLIERNVARLIGNDDTEQVEEEHSNFPVPTSEQAAQLLEAIEGHPWCCFIILAMMLGIRRGELLALRWEDIDLDGGWVHVRNAIQRVPIKQLKVKPTKRFSGAGSRLAPLKTGAKSRRSLELSPWLCELLAERRAEQNLQRERAGEKWREQGFVFASDHGDNWNPNTASETFAEVRKLAGLPAEIHLHSMRHLVGSALMKTGANPKVAQHQLGHARLQITMDKYSHFLPGERNSVPDKMEGWIAEGKARLGSRPPKVVAVKAEVQELERIYAAKPRKGRKERA